MITVKVTYGVKKEFEAKNKVNIGVFIADFRAMDSKDFEYDVYILNDETTFVHISRYANKQIQEQVLGTPSFLLFQQQRDASGLLVAHHIEELHHFGSSNSDKY